MAQENDNMKFHGLDQFQEWLVNNGFTICENTGRSDYNEADWHAYRRLPSARECEMNGSKVFLWIDPYVYSGIGYAACEAEVTGMAGGMWFDFKVYVATPDELMSRLPEIETKLVTAWNSLVPIDAENN